MRLSQTIKKTSLIPFLIFTLIAVNLPVQAMAVSGNPATYTLDAHFDEGTLINVNYDAPNNDQLQLNDAPEPLNYIWIAASKRGTIIKIDTTTGDILGEYQSAPDGHGRNPSRTTVDANGNVWVGNRADNTLDVQNNPVSSAIHIGLEENGQCEDRNNNGVIDTSTGLGDILDWDNPAGVDDDGGVTSAEDECIIKYVRVPGYTTRHVSIDTNNNVWIGSHGTALPFEFTLLDGNTGATLAGFNVGCGGYGGLMDQNGVLWSASRLPDHVYKLLRYDTNGTISTADDTWACLDIHRSYGLATDSNGNIWNTQYNNGTIMKLDPAGVPFVGFPKNTGGAGYDRGVVVTADDNVWVANSAGSDVSRLDKNGNVLKVIPVGTTPTGLSVDAAGKVWVTNRDSNNTMRIDPNGDGDGLGIVDLTVDLGDDSRPYNYSDMTGSFVPAAPTNGTWTLIHDSGVVGVEWGTISWTADEPDDSSISVTVASSVDGVTFGPTQSVTDGIHVTVADGRYLKVDVSFVRATNGDSPILYDLTIEYDDEPPTECEPEASVDSLWPPNHKFRSVSILGVDNVIITSIYQDEPVDTFGDGWFTPDGKGVGTSTAQVRAERTGTRKVPGDGRVYHIGFTGTHDGRACTGVVTVGVPHDQGPNGGPIDGGPLFDSTVE